MTLDQIWKNVKEELRICMAPAVFQTFAAKTELLILQEDKATIGCPNAYMVDINHKRYYQLFQAALDHQTQHRNTLEFIIQEPLRVDTDPKPIGPLFSPPPYETKAGLPAEAGAKAGLHPKYTFENLIVGNSNNFAYAAAQGIVKNPGLSYNPFFIWGGVGVGKTHLMQAIGHELLKNNPALKVKYFPAETFGNELIAALRGKTISQFKEKYRNLDCFLVDDIQFIAGKEYIQEEFFHTFNALHLAGKQVVLTSDRKPSEIDHLEDRLVSRFMGGLTVDIQPPDYEMRVAIIKQKAEEQRISLQDEAVHYLAENIVSNIRDIQGRLQQLIVQAQAGHLENLTLEFVQGVLAPNSVSPAYTLSNNNLTPRHIISVCAKHFNIKTGELCGNSRKKELVTARHITAYLLLNEINLPLEEVGRLLGGRDHTSIMHARDKISTTLSTNPQLQQLINQIKSTF
ncbi:chromosomal replication initiator protein DnaA [Patescibacteria group bacterium]|nr:chromosomal replication initiator protein DnaA [Patescibacteria group bacterium]